MAAIFGKDASVALKVAKSPCRGGGPAMALRRAVAIRAVGRALTFGQRDGQTAGWRPFAGSAALYRDISAKPAGDALTSPNRQPGGWSGDRAAARRAAIRAVARRFGRASDGPRGGDPTMGRCALWLPNPQDSQAARRWWPNRRAGGRPGHGAAAYGRYSRRGASRDHRHLPALSARQDCTRRAPMHYGPKRESHNARNRLGAPEGA